MLEKEIENIILKEKDVIPFLKKLTIKDKREIATSLKKLHKKILETKFIEKKLGGGITYTSLNTHSDKQRKAIEIVCFVCLNKTDVKRTLFNVSNLAVDDYYLENIIPWYKPKWYNDVINEETPWGLSYEKMMRLQREGLIEPSHTLIVNKLPNAIIENKHVNKKHKSFYRPEILTKYKETLEEHIWLLFEEESSINNYYSYLHLENYKDGNGVWISTITNLVLENKLDRKKVLIATIYSSTKGFNKTLSGWFFDLLIKLAPTSDEILDLQSEFFAALNSPHSKVINTVLKYFKTVANNKKFSYKTFIDNTSVLLNSETKSVVNSTLMILDKIAKTVKSSNISVCQKATEALINVDEKIQLRAAKIIDKYGDSKRQELSDGINMYADSLFHSSKELLKEYLILSEDIEEDDSITEKVELITKENELAKYESVDDLIFFVSQAIDNNEVYHIDLLMNYLPKLNVLLNKDNVAKLEPIFKRAFDFSMNFDWNSQVGSLESEAAFYLNDFAEILISKYPLELKNYKEIKNQKIKKFKETSYFTSHYKNNLKEIEHQQVPGYIYQIHHFLFIKSKSLIKKKLTLDLLSTPTHTPCWIDPKILIDRIISYEKKNEEINLYDFQIAIGRLPLNEYSRDLIKDIDKIKDIDIKKVLKYHFDFVELQHNTISRPELWLQSVLTKNNNTDILYLEEHLLNPLNNEKGSYDWNCKLRDHFYKDYDYSTRKYVQKKMVRKELKFKDFNTKKNGTEAIVSSIKGIFNKKKKTTKIISIYQYIHFNKQKYYTTIQPNDDVKFLFLSPNNPSMYLTQVIHNNLRESTFFYESGKKNMVNLLKGLYEIWNRPNFKESTYLFLATGLLCSHKVARELSAEIWIKTNSENNINNLLLGETLGKLESGEYAPLKRFTDLLTSNLFNISKKHNKHLYTLLDNMIGGMNDTPLRGVKKLLELFLELKHNFPQVEISKTSIEKLSKWKETKTLKPIISKLL